MKKQYEKPEWEMVLFSVEEMRTTASCPDDTCPEDCTHCYYLVCQPSDVIIGG